MKAGRTNREKGFHHNQAYGKTIQESEEVKLLKKRYGQLEAEAALLKANLAAKSDAAGEQVAAYLDESSAWYDGGLMKINSEFIK